MNKCIICSLKVSNSQDKYCSNHMEAYYNLKKHYEMWNKAFDGLTWIEYMNKLLKLSETGSWVREVICTEMRTVT